MRHAGSRSEIDLMPQAAASRLVGSKIRNPQGEELGKLEELVIDMERGCIAYGVLSFGGVLGIGSKLFAVPWQTLRLDSDEECFVLDVDREALENAPGFEKDDWPATADDGWLREVYIYYGHLPYWEDV